MTKVKKVLIGVGIGTSIGVLVVGALFSAKYFMHNRLPVGTSVANISLSFDTPAKALTKVEKEFNEYLNSNIEFEVEGRFISVKPKNLGIELFAKESLANFKPGDSKNGSLKDFYFSGGKTVAPVAKIDENKLYAEIEKRLNLKQIAPKPATYYFDENNSLAIREGKKGFRFDRESLLSTIETSVKNLSPIKVSLQMSLQEPQLTKADLEAQIADMRATLNQNITLADPVYSEDWNEKLINHLDWVSFEANDFEKKVAIKINSGALNKFVDAEISEWLDDPVQPVKISLGEDKKAVIEGRGHNGMRIKREELRQGIENALATKTTEIEIPIEELTPELNVSEDLIAKGIKERIGIGHTSFYGSPVNRVHNVNVAAARFNGMIIEPGEIFSFNENLGAVDASTGYRKELVIKKEGTIPEYGGGVCQVSTTMYRAILFSGLPIEERHPHSYAVSYYSQVMGDGLDATIYLGGPDLQFKNDTENSIVVQSYVKDDYELYFVFYGTSDGRSVEMEGPFLSNYHSPGPTIYQETDTLAPGQQKQVEKYHVGFSANWYRNITFANGETKKELIESKYRAVPNRILVGAGEAPVPTEGT